ncbi:NAD-dependent epimerase/dehydratase family protein [Acidovorax sp. DW039]|uniref:NAD-dependent epimerase/dehydratase family protein n=1 Tax=Acidovorax sp. DW039 TaxID=3095606 RepID=UPI0030D3FF6D
MQVLLTGATGFIGRAIAAALRRAGHTVHAGHSPRRHQGAGVPMDFARDTDAATWLPRLQGIDAVVNAVGVLRHTAARPIDAVHQRTPVALFEACRQAGVRHVVQISALGVQTGTTRYAHTKRAADEHLLGLAAAPRSTLRGVVLRPSVVFGQGGASTALFMRLARLPVLVLPGPVLTARIQPLAVQDLADAVVALLGSHSRQRGVVPCAGPEALTIAALIASLRAQCGHQPAHVLRLPTPLTHLSARLGDWVPLSPWGSETLAMLATDNVADPAPLQALLGHPATHYSQLVERARATTPTGAEAAHTGAPS